MDTLKLILETVLRAVIRSDFVNFEHTVELLEIEIYSPFLEVTFGSE